MAVISYTPANVVATSNATVKASGTSGAAITVGQPVYLDPADGKIKPAKADSGSVVSAQNLVGIALDSAAGANQPITYATGGQVTFGSGLTVGQIYVVGHLAAGDIELYSDLGTGHYVEFLGVATSTSVMQLGIISGLGIQKP